MSTLNYWYSNVDYKQRSLTDIFGACLVCAIISSMFILAFGTFILEDIAFVPLLLLTLVAAFPYVEVAVKANSSSTSPRVLTAASYKKHYGKDLKVTEANAGLEFVKRLAKNNPVLYNEDYEIAVAVGTKGQSKAPIGIYSLGRHRENAKKNLALALCDVDPFKGLNQPTYMQIVKGAPHPNAARLLAYYVLTQEGANPWVGVVGAYSSNSSLGSSADNPYPTAEAWKGTLLVSNNTNVANRRADLMDFWIKHSN